jgi:hypothetical protein
LERRPSHGFGSQQLVELVETIMAIVVIQQTQPFHKTFWLNVPIMGIIERPLVQQNI